MRHTVTLFASENSNESLFVGDYCTIENTCYIGEGIALNYGIIRVSPHWSRTALGFLAPRHIRQGRGNDFNIGHNILPPDLIKL
jgi:hypothetical protein